MMKQLLAVLFVLILVVGFAAHSHADLFNRGTDINGNRLIYDSDLNITWYDYTKSSDNWQNQVNWASGLSVSGGNLVGVYVDWRLPSTVDGPYVKLGYDGTTTAGYNIISSEMGHLYYAELRNMGWYDTSGNRTDCSIGDEASCLTNKGDFQNLQPYFYWSGSVYAADSYGKAWAFAAKSGTQYATYFFSNDFYAMAVRPGDVAVVPEPVSMILFLTGGATLIVRKYLRRKV